jgi:hypothetical protein
MQNEFYIGMVRHYDDLNEGVHKPMISQELFERCLEVRKKHAKAPADTRHQSTGKTPIFSNGSSTALNAAGRCASNRLAGITTTRKSPCNAG